MAGPGRRLRELLAQPGAVAAAGAYSALSARMVEQAGFQAVYASGAGVSNSLLGEPDVGLVTQTEMVAQVRYMAQATALPIVADADTGYGNALNVVRTVREFESAGAAAIQLEDQVMPKRCGHFEGKQVISAGEMVSKLHAALDARRDPDLMVIARTDARAVLGMEEALRRGRLYLQAGADMVFVEAPGSLEELGQVGALPGWQLANMVEDGKTPLLSVAELSGLGFKLVIFPNTALRAAMKAMAEVLGQLKADGSSKGLLDRVVTMGQRNQITGMAGIKELERRYGSPADESL